MKPHEYNDGTKSKLLRIAVIGRDGSVEHRHVSMHDDEGANGSGKIVFPFKEGNVHSEAWRACDHTTLITRKMSALQD